MSIKKINILLILALATSFFGCASVSGQRDSLLDKNWGRSFETAKYNQTVNPEAGKNPGPLTGLDGTASENNRERYLNSFSREDPPTIYNLNIGNLTGR